MKIGIVTYAYIEPYGYEKGIDKLIRHGYGCIDYSSHKYPNLVDTNHELFSLSETEFEKSLRRERELYRSAGIEISQTHGPWRYPPQDGTKEDRDERFLKMAKAVRGTAYLGCETIVVHPLMPFGSHSDAEPETQWQINLEFMSRLAEIGEEYGVTVCFENMPFRELPLSPIKEILRMVKAVNSKYFSVCLDTGHCAVLGDSPSSAVRLLGKEYLKVMHVHDNNGQRDYHWLPGTGVIDWDDFSSALYEIGFDGTLSLETGAIRFKEGDEDLESRELEIANFAKKIARIS